MQADFLLFCVFFAFFSEFCRFFDNPQGQSEARGFSFSTQKSVFFRIFRQDPAANPPQTYKNTPLPCFAVFLRTKPAKCLALSCHFRDLRQRHPLFLSSLQCRRPSPKNFRTEPREEALNYLSSHAKLKTGSSSILYDIQLEQGGFFYPFLLKNSIYKRCFQVYNILYLQFIIYHVIIIRLNWCKL